MGQGKAAPMSKYHSNTPLSNTDWSKTHCSAHNDSLSSLPISLAK